MKREKHPERSCRLEEDAKQSKERIKEERDSEIERRREVVETIRESRL